MNIVLPGLLAFNSAFARTEFLSAEFNFASQSYDCIDCAYSWQTVVRGGASSPATEPSGEASSSGAHRRRAAQVPPRSTNDQRIITYLKNKVVELEAALKNTELLLHRSTSHPTAEFSQREDFFLREIDLISRQLQGWYPLRLLSLLKLASSDF